MLVTAGSREKSLLLILPKPVIQLTEADPQLGGGGRPVAVVLLEDAEDVLLPQSLQRPRRVRAAIVRRPGRGRRGRLRRGRLELKGRLHPGGRGAADDLLPPPLPRPV